MNLDDPDEGRELSTYVENYLLTEFVAVPPDFDIESHLSMREHVGIFQVSKLNRNQLILIADSIKSSAIFSSMNNALMNPKHFYFILQLFSELNLIIKKVDNPLRRYKSDEVYLDFAKRWEEERSTLIRGQDVKRVSFVIINLFHIFQDDVIGETWSTVQEIQKFQEEINSMTFNLNS